MKFGGKVCKKEHSEIKMVVLNLFKHHHDETGTSVSAKILNCSKPDSNQRHEQLTRNNVEVILLDISRILRISNPLKNNLLR